MVLHPTDLSNLQMAVAVHVLALLMLPVMLFGLAGLNNKLGWDDPLAATAFIVYGFGMVAAMMSAAASGLIAPELVRRMPASDEATRQALGAMFRYTIYVNQAFAKVMVVASSLGVIGWSAAIAKSSMASRSITIAGIVSGRFGIVGVVSGHLQLNVHGFGLYMLLHATWLVLVGARLYRKDSWESL
jgi:hypothetical protein